MRKPFRGEARLQRAVEQVLADLRATAEHYRTKPDTEMGWRESLMAWASYANAAALVERALRKARR